MSRTESSDGQIPEQSNSLSLEGPASVPDSPSLASAITRRTSGPADPKILFCSALLGSVIAWLIMCNFYPFYTIYAPVPNSAPVPRGPRELDKDQAFLWNMWLGYGLYGLAVGACLGVGYVLHRRSVGWIVLGLVTCGVLGGVTGSMGGYAANLFFEYMGRTAETNAVVQTMIGQGVAWVVCGLGLGLGLGLFAKGWTQFFYSAAGGAISGVLAGGVHAPLHAAIFADNDFSLRLPDGTVAQLMWLTLPAVLAATVIGGLKAPAPDKIE